MINVYIFLLSTLTMPLCASYLERKAEGWHFYEKPATDKRSKATSHDPLKQLQAFKHKVERLKARAVLHPSFDNVRAYMQLQKCLIQKASVFARRWLEVVYTTPSLDYTRLHPTSQAARHVYLDMERQKTYSRIRLLAQTHGLFFFFSGDCPYCKNFAPIVKMFSDTYGWNVLAISMDGSTLPEFPEAVQDNGSSARLGITLTPTLLAISPKYKEVIPLSYGMTSHDQIIDRIRVLILEREKA